MKNVKKVYFSFRLAKVVEFETREYKKVYFKVWFKGQLISKCPFGVTLSTKISSVFTDLFTDFAYKAKLY